MIFHFSHPIGSSDMLWKRKVFPLRIRFKWANNKRLNWFSPRRETRKLSAVTEVTNSLLNVFGFVKMEIKKKLFWMQKMAAFFVLMDIWNPWWNLGASDSWCSDENTHTFRFAFATLKHTTQRKTSQRNVFRQIQSNSNVIRVVFFLLLVSFQLDSVAISHFRFGLCTESR